MVDALKRNWIVVALLILMAAFSLYAWPRLSEPLPVHWDLSGEPDRWAGRWEALWLIPAITVGVFALLVAVPRLEPAGRKNLPIVRTARTAVVATMAFLHFIVVFGYLNTPVNIPRVVSLALGVLFLVVGNVLPRAHPSYFVGLRLPWLYLSDRAWYYAQRLSGWVMTITGAALILAGIVWPTAVIAVPVLMVVALVVVSMRSYSIFREEQSSRT